VLNWKIIKAFCSQLAFKCVYKPERTIFTVEMVKGIYRGQGWQTVPTGLTTRETFPVSAYDPNFGVYSVIRWDCYASSYTFSELQKYYYENNYSAAYASALRFYRDPLAPDFDEACELTVIGEVPSKTSDISGLIAVSTGPTTPLDGSGPTPSPAPVAAQPPKHYGGGKDSLNACHVGDPIEIGTGNVYESFTDYAAAGERALKFTRFYNSLSTTSTFLGRAWRSNFDRTLVVTRTNGAVSAITAQRPDGQELRFTLSGTAWVSDSDVDMKLVASGTSWVLTDRNDVTETYSSTNAAGVYLVTFIRERGGYTQTVVYDAGGLPASVTDSFGRKLAFTVSGGLLQSVTAPDGLVVSYGYSASTGSTLNRLRAVSHATTPAATVQYLYETAAFPFAMTGLTDELDNRYTTWTYDSTGRGLTSQHAGGADLTTIAYGTQGATVTGALGAQTLFPFTAGQNGLKVSTVARQATGGLSSATSASTYDSSGYVASQSDWNGNTVTYVNNSRGQPTRITEANATSAARMTTTTWHSTFHLPTQIVEPARTLTFTHDTSGNVLTKTITADTKSRKWTYTYNSFGQVLTATDPAGHKTTYTYDAAGNQTSMTNAVGHVTTTTFDASGRPLRITDPNGLVTTFTYDARGRVTSTAVGGEKTTFTYDAAGNLATLKAPDGATLTYTYDAAHRLTRVKDALNNTVAYSLDAEGNRTRTDDADAAGVIKRTRSATYDALGRIIKTVGGMGQTAAYTYDANGNHTRVTDPLSRARNITYDALDRVAQQVDAAGGTTAFTYDSLDNITGVRDPRSLTTSYTFDGLGDQSATTNPDTGATTRTFDAAGNVVTSTDARGVTTTTSYDALNRPVTRFSSDATPVVYFIYDEGINGIGHLTTMTDGSGTTRWTYDQRGRVLTKTQDVGLAALTTRMTYDAAGRLATVTYPSGLIIDITRNATGQVAGVTSGTTKLAGDIAYTPWGAAASWTTASGAAYARTFDADGRMTAIAYGGTILGYTFDAADRITATTETGLPTKAFGYDTLGRLTSHVSGATTQAYTYDANGNRTSVTQGTPATTYAIAANNNWLTATSGGRTASFTYDASGRMTAAMDGGAPSYHAYDARGARVATYTATFSSFNAFNGMGERVIRNGFGAVPQIGRVFVYDDAHHLLGEYDLSGRPVQETVWLGDTPIATFMGKQTYAIYADQVGAPHAIADQTGKTVWQWDHDPFGNGTPTGTIAYNLRFPGQYQDPDTGLLYNMARDYNPILGRYLQSDPIGLDGGINTYAYAGGNPVSFADPTGQFVPLAFPVAVATGAFIGAISGGVAAYISDGPDAIGAGAWAGAAVGGAAVFIPLTATVGTAGVLTSMAINAFSGAAGTLAGKYAMDKMNEPDVWSDVAMGALYGVLANVASVEFAATSLELSATTRVVTALTTNAYGLLFSALDPNAHVSLMKRPSANGPVARPLVAHPMCLVQGALQ